MSQWQNLGVIENNDVLFSFNLTFNNSPLDVTNYVLSLVVKSSQAASDQSGTIYTVGSGLTVLNASLGQVSWRLPGSATGTPGQQWYRLDATGAIEGTITVMMGNLGVMAA